MHRSMWYRARNTHPARFFDGPLASQSLSLCRLSVQFPSRLGRHKVNRHQYLFVL